jgi:hypothetical protein
MESPSKKERGMELFSAKTKIAIGVLGACLIVGGYVIAWMRGEIAGHYVAKMIGSAADLNWTVGGKIGREYNTRWFGFTVESARMVDEYAGYEPAEGNALLDVVLSEKNTFDDGISMSSWDFYVDATDFEDYAWPIDAADETMMPDEFELAPGESVKYHVVYEVPAGAEEMSLVYREEDENDKTFRTFSIKIN